MKKIPFVPTVELEDIHGDPIYDAPQVVAGVTLPRRRAIVRHATFLLARITDEKYAGPRTGIEAVEFVIAARVEIRTQESTAEARGFWLIEDDRAASLQSVALHPTGGYLPNIQHCLMPFLASARDMSDYKQETVPS